MTRAGTDHFPGASCSLSSWFGSPVDPWGGPFGTKTLAQVKASTIKLYWNTWARHNAGLPCFSVTVDMSMFSDQQIIDAANSGDGRMTVAFVLYAAGGAYYELQ